MQKNIRQATLFPPKIMEVEIIYRAGRLKNSSQIQCAEDCYKVLKSLYDPRTIDYKEYFYVLLLNRSNYIIGASRIGEGSTIGVAVNLKEILQLALKSNSSGVVISHNHPSQSIIPSDADNKLTKRVKDACALMEITLIDHLIITSGDNYYSYANEGRI